MSEPQDTFEGQLTKPRIGFLVAAAVAALLAVTAYIYEDEIVGSGPDSAGITYAFLLVSLVLVSMFFVLCYRSPKIGGRLLGYDRLSGKPTKKIKADVQYSAGFKLPTGADTKRQNSQRKQVRASRKKLAAVTREMQKQHTDEPAEEFSEKPKSSSQKPDQGQKE